MNVRLLEPAEQELDEAFEYCTRKWLDWATRRAIRRD